MPVSSDFRIYYASEREVVTEQVRAAALPEAISIAELHCAALPQTHYFEVWRGASLLYAATDAASAG